MKGASRRGHRRQGLSFLLRLGAKRLFFFLLALVMGAALWLYPTSRHPSGVSAMTMPTEDQFPPVVDSPLPDATLQERGGLLCRVVGQELAAYEPDLRQAAFFHNRLKGVSNDQLARWIAAIIMTERTGSPLWRTPLVDDLVHPLWDRFKVLGAETGLNVSVGWARIRPQTVVDLQQGWISHQGEMVFHNVRVYWPRSSQVSRVGLSGARNLSLSRVAEVQASIELLAANLEMGTIVARRFGYEPTLEDLARWHNTGIGPWGWVGKPLNFQLWDKGTEYVRRVEAVEEALSFISWPQGCAPRSQKEKEPQRT